MTISQWQIYRERIKAWEACKATMKLGKTQEELLTTSLENRHEVQHHNHKRQGEMPFNHLPKVKTAKSKTPVHHEPLPGEVPIKIWAQEIMDREHISKVCVWQRLQRGKYPEVIRRWVNKRVVFVHVANNFEI